MMLSESQERMLMVLKPEKEEEAKAIFRKWGHDFAVIGHTTDDLRFRIKLKGEVMADLPIKELGDEAPLYDRPHVPTPKKPVIEASSVTPPLSNRDALLKHCQQHEVPAGPINTIADIFEDPQFAALQNLVEIFDPLEGRVVVPNVLPKLSETPGELKWLGPDMGQHNDEIYRGRLGLSAEEVERLKSEGII